MRDGLVEFARSKGVEILFDTTVTDLSPSAGAFTLTTSKGELPCDRVIVATGGLSVPATGSDGTGLDIAQRLGHRMIDTYPALTPLLGNRRLACVAVGRLAERPAAREDRIEDHRDLWRASLFTHRGYSGPSVLDISHLTREGGSADHPRAVVRAHGCGVGRADLEARSASVLTILARHVPGRLAEHLMIEAGMPADRRTSSLKRSERLALIDALTAYPLPWSGNEGYKKAEVTGGGVALDEVDPKTLESKKVAGLYLCGEMLDAFGPIGGHNFAWAWATGRAAGLAAGAADRRTAVERSESHR